MNTTIEERLVKLEKANRRWRRACAGVVAVAATGVLIAQAAPPGVQPTILCRGVKIFDPQGRKRGEFVMANGAVAVRMFDENGNVLTRLDKDDLSFLATDGTPFTSLSFSRGLELGDPHGAQTRLTEGGLAVFDSTQRARATLSLGGQSQQPGDHESPSLFLFTLPGAGGYEYTPDGAVGFPG